MKAQSLLSSWYIIQGGSGLANLPIAWAQTSEVAAASGSGVSAGVWSPVHRRESYTPVAMGRLTPAMCLYHSDGLSPPRLGGTVNFPLTP